MCDSHQQSFVNTFGIVHINVEAVKKQELTRKHASTCLNRLLSMSAPTTVLLLITTRLLHTATACLSLLLQRRAVFCSGSNAAFSTGKTPCSSACNAYHKIMFEVTCQNTVA